MLRSAHLGMMLFASSASAGHKFAICAVSNCVNSGSLRKILKIKTKQVRCEHNTYLTDKCRAKNTAAGKEMERERERESPILSDSRCRIGGVELCKSLDVF